MDETFQQKVEKLQDAWRELMYQVKIACFNTALQIVDRIRGKK